MSVPAGVRHGTSTAYVTYRCRCDECSGWQRERMARYHETRRVEQDSARIAWPEDDESPPEYEPDDWDDDRRDDRDDADYSDDFESERTGTGSPGDFDGDERDDHRADPDAENFAAASGGIGSLVAIGAGVLGLGALVAALRQRSGARAALAVRAASVHSRLEELLGSLVQRASGEQASRRPEWRAELMAAQSWAGSLLLARRGGPCCYVEASRHRGTRDGDALCTHALALPSSVRLPTLARCPACSVARIIIGGARLRNTPLGAHLAQPATRADFAAAAEAGYHIAP